MTSLVDHDVTDDAGKNAVDAVGLGDDLDVDETTSEWATVRLCPTALDVHRRPVEGAVDTGYRAAEPTCRRHGVFGARKTTTHVDVETINFVPLVGKRCRFAYSQQPQSR